MLKICSGEMVTGKRATRGIIGEHDSSESERNYSVQGKEELMLVIIEGSE